MHRQARQYGYAAPVPRLPHGRMYGAGLGGRYLGAHQFRELSQQQGGAPARSFKNARRAIRRRSAGRLRRARRFARRRAQDRQRSAGRGVQAANARRGYPRVSREPSPRARAAFCQNALCRGASPAQISAARGSGGFALLDIAPRALRVHRPQAPLRPLCFHGILSHVWQRAKPLKHIVI